MNIGILLVCGLEVQGKYTLITATLPSLVYFWLVAKNRGGRFFFTFCLADTVMLWVMMVTGLIDYAVGSEGLVTFVLRLLAFPVMLEFANPCPEGVKMGPDGIPMSKQDGHGLGTRSIVAFAEKHGAVYAFRMEDGWFKLQLAL